MIISGWFAVLPGHGVGVGRSRVASKGLGERVGSQMAPSGKRPACVVEPAHQLGDQRVIARLVGTLGWFPWLLAPMPKLCSCISTPAVDIDHALLAARRL